MKLTKIESYEIQAFAFLVMTGYVAPGKDPSPMADETSYEERSAAFDEWRKEHAPCILAMLLAFDALIDRDGDMPPALRIPEPMTPNDIHLAAGAELDGLLDHIYEYGTMSEGVMPLVVPFARAVEAETLRRVKEANSAVAMPAPLRQPPPLTDEEVDALIDETEYLPTDRAVRYLVSEGERRVKEANDAAAAPTPPVQQDDEVLGVLRRIILAYDDLLPDSKDALGPRIARYNAALEDARAMLAKRGAA